jgi:DUF971 family protein
MSAPDPKIQPKSILREGDGIRIEWQDGHVGSYPAPFLRRKCPCAVCKEMPGRENGMLPPSALPPGKMEILSAKPVGWYALQFTFSDRHDTGIFSYELLRENCPCSECRPQV